MENTQSQVAINVALLQKDVYFHLRMGLRPDLHKKYYPTIPIPDPKPKKELVVPTHFEYGEDPYKDLRKELGVLNYDLVFGEC